MSVKSVGELLRTFAIVLSLLAINGCASTPQPLRPLQQLSDRLLGKPTELAGSPAESRGDQVMDDGAVKQAHYVTPVKAAGKSVCPPGKS